MGRAKKKPPKSGNSTAVDISPLIWLRARYQFHSFSYRDPRGAFSAAVALPVVSPTSVLLGICSTLYEFGRELEAEDFLRTIHLCRVKVDPPDGAVFFRAFHQLRRYVTTQVKDPKKGLKPNIGFTEINQGTREYGLLQGPLTLYVGIPEAQRVFVVDALLNRGHIGTHDSLCSLIGKVEEDVPEPKEILCDPLMGEPIRLGSGEAVTVVTLSRFISAEFSNSPMPWRMAGGQNTELVPFVIPGSFKGTRSGKIYRKNE